MADPSPSQGVLIKGSVGPLPVVMAEVGLLMMISDGICQYFEIVYSKRKVKAIEKHEPQQESVGQTTKEEPQKYDAFRTTRFGVMGTFLAAPAFYLGFKYLNEVAPGVNLSAAVKKLILEQLIASPISHVVLLIVNTLLASGCEWATVWRRIKQSFWSLQLAAWKIWPIVMLVNFAIIPTEHQILVHRLFAVLWDVWVSHKANEPLLEDTEAGGKPPEQNAKGSPNETSTTASEKTPSTVPLNEKNSGGDVCTVSKSKD